MSNTMEKVYLDAQAACGLKVGDWVKVLRRAEVREAGWQGAWDIVLNRLIGKVFQICSISHFGIQVKYGPDSDWKPIFPYFVLEKVEKPAHEFKPFDRVLVRDREYEEWQCDLFSNFNKKADSSFKYWCVGDRWNQCIPYEGNEHLVGTTDSPEK